MDMVKCVIIEDEFPSAEELKYILSKHKNMSVVGVAYDGDTGIELTKKQKPNVVFIDINMPVKNGIEVAKIIKDFNYPIDIIFVTAYAKYAVQAFEMYVLDYVLKPFDESRINITINRIIDKWNKTRIQTEKIPNMLNTIIDKIDKDKKLLKKVPCERKGKIILVDLKDIYYFFIENEKTYVKTQNNKYIVGCTLCQIQCKTNFFRCHRSYLVNMDNVKEFYSWFNGSYKLVMADNEKSEIPISRTNVKKLKDYFEI